MRLISVSVSVDTSTKVLGIGIKIQNVVSPSTTNDTPAMVGDLFIVCMALLSSWLPLLAQLVCHVTYMHIIGVSHAYKCNQSLLTEICTRYTVNLPVASPGEWFILVMNYLYHFRVLTLPLAAEVFS